MVGWGGTFGAIKAATLELQQQGITVSACHVRYSIRCPNGWASCFKQFKHVLVPELNLGQLRMLLRNRYPGGRQGAQQGEGPAVHHS